MAEADGLTLHPFDADRLCIALGREHPLAGREVLAVADLADEPFILWPMVEGRGFHLQVVRLCANAGFVPRVVQEAHGMHAVLSLVAVGAGVAIVPESMKTFREDRIDYRRINEPAAAFPLCLATLASSFRASSPAAAAFVEMAASAGP